MMRWERLRFLILMSALTLLGGYLITLFSRALTREMSGWIMAGLILAALFYAVVKKSPALPLGRMVVWRRIHLLVSLLAVLFYPAHVGGVWWPGGMGEMLLALAFVVVSFSGLVGYWFSLIMPRRMTERGDSVLREHMTMRVERLTRRADPLMEEMVTSHGASPLADFHMARLRPYLTHPRLGWLESLDPRRTSYAITHELQVLERYLDPRETEIIPELLQLVKTKDELDFHLTQFRLLRVWLFVHVPAALILPILILLHLLTVYGFQTG